MNSSDNMKPKPNMGIISEQSIKEVRADFVDSRTPEERANEPTFTTTTTEPPTPPKPIEGEWREIYTKFHDETYDGQFVREAEAFLEKEIESARREERERIAQLVERWHINKGGYTEMAHQIRTNLK